MIRRRQRGFYNLPAEVPFPSTVVPSLWLDGRLPAYSDAAQTVIAIAPFGRVNKAIQPYPLTGSWTAPNTTNARPWREGVSFLCETVPYTGVPNRGLSLTAPVAATLPRNGATVGFSFCSRDILPAGFQQRGLLIGADNTTGDIWGVAITNGTFYLNASNAQQINTSLPVAPSVHVAGVATWTAAGMAIKLRIAGVDSTFSYSGAVAAGTINQLAAGSMAPVFNEGLNASVSQIIGVSRAITSAEVDSLLAWLEAHPPDAAFPTDANLVAVSGDSIAQGFGLPTSAYSYPFLMQPSVEALGPKMRLLNGAVSGYTVAQCQALFNSTIAPLYSAARSRNVLMVQCATNSMAFGSLTAAQVLAQYYALCDQAKAQGWRVIACTVLPRTDGGIRGTFEADRLTFNADVVANFGAHARGLCRFDTVAGMSTVGDTTGPNYSADHVHPNATGAALLAPTYLAAITVALS